MLQDSKATQAQVNEAAKALNKALAGLKAVPKLTKLEAFVDNLYKNIMGRDYDAGGLAYWVNALQKGEITGADALVFFVFGDAYSTVFGRVPDV